MKENGFLRQKKSLPRIKSSESFFFGYPYEGMEHAPVSNVGVDIVDTLSLNLQSSLGRVERKCTCKFNDCEKIQIQPSQKFGVKIRTLVFQKFEIHKYKYEIHTFKS